MEFDEIMQLQISSRRESRYKAAWVIKTRIVTKDLSKQHFHQIQKATLQGQYRGDIAALPYLRTQYAITQKSPEPSFCKVTEFFWLKNFISMVTSLNLVVDRTYIFRGGHSFSTYAKFSKKLARVRISG